jgi:AraC-like DNA-binding protein
MIFYEIELLSIPKIIHACSVDTDRYKNHFNHEKDFLEIALLERGNIIFEHFDGRKETTCPGMVLPVFSDMACNTYFFGTEGQRHTTVGVTASYNLRRHNTEDGIDVEYFREKTKNPNTVLIPYHEMLDVIFEDVVNVIRKISSQNLAHDARGKFSALGQWFILAGMMTDFVMKKIDVDPAISPSEHLYISKACRYIDRFYAQKITVSEIAEHLNISEGYLHRMFRQVKNTGVLEYINKRRVSVAIDLINNHHLSLKEAAYNVGISEPAYMSRLFKKVTGVSYLEYFRNKEVP